MDPLASSTITHSASGWIRQNQYMTYEIKEFDKEVYALFFKNESGLHYMSFQSIASREEFIKSRLAELESVTLV